MLVKIHAASAAVGEGKARATRTELVSLGWGTERSR